MKFICRKYSSSGKYIEETVLSSDYDKVEGKKISETIEALEYCKKYLTSKRDIEKDNYFICYRG